MIPAVPNRFKYRQNAPFSVFFFFSAVLNRFKCRQNAPFSVLVFKMFSEISYRLVSYHIVSGKKRSFRNFIVGLYQWCRRATLRRKLSVIIYTRMYNHKKNMLNIFKHYVSFCLFMVVLIYLWNNASSKIPSIFKHSLLPKFSQKLSKTTYLKGRGGKGSIPRTMIVVFIVATWVLYQWKGVIIYRVQVILTW